MERQVQLWPPPAVLLPPSLHLTFKAVVKELCPSSSLRPSFLSLSREPPTPPPPTSICEPEGEDTCDQKPVAWQQSQKASVPVARQGAGIYSPTLHPLHPLPVSSSRPLAPPLEPTRNALSLLSQLPPSSRVRKTIFHKKRERERESKRTSCPFVRCPGQRCCLLHSTAWFLLQHTHTWTMWKY